MDPNGDHKKALIIAGRIVTDLGVCVLETLAVSKKRWVDHILRMGTAGKPPHLIKAVLLWRPREWWEYQRLFNDIPGFSFNTIKHPPELGHPLRFEEQFGGKLLNWLLP